MTPDARYASWVEQFDLIVNDVYALHHHRHLFREIRDIAAAANLPSSTFFDAFGLWYASSQSAALRRLVDRRKGTVSLIRLLEDIARNPKVMNRDRHVGLWGNDRFFIAQGNRNFDRFAKASGDDTVDRDAVNADINAVNGIVSKVEKYVDENVAHRSAPTDCCDPNVRRTTRRYRRHRRDGSEVWLAVESRDAGGARARHSGRLVGALPGALAAQRMT